MLSKLPVCTITRYTHAKHEQILKFPMTFKPYFTNADLVWKAHYYGEFALSLRKESPYTFSKFNLLILTLSMAPLVPILKRFDCVTFSWIPVSNHCWNNLAHNYDYNKHPPFDCTSKWHSCLDNSPLSSLHSQSLSQLNSQSVSQSVGQDQSASQWLFQLSQPVG